MRKLIFVSFICIQLLRSAFPQQKIDQVEQHKPNIIFILGDDIGYYIPTVNGGQSYSTPNIDSMARHGMNFTHCEASPLCNPSRFMFLTGKYNFRNYSNWGYMSDSEKTIANVMHDAGYVTGIFGKLQLQYKHATMQKWGWDSHIIFELTEDTMKYRRYKDPVLLENGYRIPDSMTAGKYCDDILTQRILDFIDTNKTKPFFVYYPMSIGHDPFSPTPDDSTFVNWNSRSSISDPAYFPSMIKYMDKKVGQILQKLRATGLDQNTIVFFVGDNGTPVPIIFTANNVIMHGEKGKKTEGGTHVPLIAYWPGTVQAGSRCDNLIDFTDFLPTLAEAGRLKLAGQYGALDGASFYSQLTLQRGKGKQQLFFHYDPHPGGYDTLARWARNKTYKLYDSTEIFESGKFYNVVKDVYEISPLNDAGLTAKELSIKQTLQHILDTVGTWPACPQLTASFATNITSSAVVLGGTVVNQGAAALIDRGSNITSSSAGPYLNTNRLHASTVSLGTFSQKRSGLLPQTLYKFDMYAVNANLSHSTGFVYGQFYTLSNPPLRQPVSFTAATRDSITILSWTDAVFPKKGAEKAGYLLLYSTVRSPRLQQIKNGQPPSSISEHVVPLMSAKLPSRPQNTAEFLCFLKDSTYYFVLVPYTWNGRNDSTYNYLTESALTVTLNQFVNVSSFNTDKIADNPTTFARLTPNPVKDVLHLKNLPSSLKAIALFDVTGKLLNQTTTSAVNYSFNTIELSAGTYFLRVDAIDKSQKFTFIKQ